MSGLLEREVASPQITSHQLQVLVNEYVVFAAHRIEWCADKILSEDPTPAIRKNALLWKINGIAACFRAASRQDPLGAYLDLWVLNRQMTHLFESPAGRDFFGPWQVDATAECHALDKRLQHINEIVSSDLQLGETFVERFAGDFPLISLHFDREPMASRYIEEVQTPSKELFQVVASLDSNIDELRKLTVVYAEHLPKQARWQAELFLVDATSLGFVQRPLQDLAMAATSVSRLADTAQIMPQLIDNEVRNLSNLVTEERKATLREIDSMRNETMHQLGVERSLILATLREEREASFTSLREERLAMTSDLNAEIARAMQATDTITRNRANELILHTPRVIDHFFWRASQVCLAFAIVAGLFAWRVIHAVSQRRSSLHTPAIFPISELSESAMPKASKTRKAA